ncbi:MAG: hypothetical protein KDB14_01265 [Planctomycetales bacterium]|nr:hypothetical protein [Planctomycetales bacterium]
MHPDKSQADPPAGSLGEQRGGVAEVEWEQSCPECDPWEGEHVYCDAIDGTIHLLGTPDHEGIFIEHVDLGILDFAVQITVIHSDLSFEYFEFTRAELLASAGLDGWHPEAVNAVYMCRLNVHTDCGDDVVINQSMAGGYFDLGPGHDSFCGSHMSEVIVGGCGSDVIFGGGGADFIAGEAGSDYLSGGMPADGVFLFPGVFKTAAFLANPQGRVGDFYHDSLDCGQDADGDHILLEAHELDGGGLVSSENYFHLDWLSPPGTDMMTLVAH